MYIESMRWRAIMEEYSQAMQHLNTLILNPIFHFSKHLENLWLFFSRKKKNFSFLFFVRYINKHGGNSRARD